MLPKFTIIPTDQAGSYAVYMNNEELHGVTAVHIDLAVDAVPKVRLEFVADKVTVNLHEADVSETTECREENHDLD